jgi:predicted XRE-type DNA-binding protein
MREMAANGAVRKDIAIKFGTSLAYVSMCVTGKVRQDAGGTLQAGKTKQKLSKEQLAEIRLLASQGIKNKTIAKMFNIDASHVSRIAADKIQRQKKEVML